MPGSASLGELCGPRDLFTGSQKTRLRQGSSGSVRVVWRLVNCGSTVLVWRVVAQYAYSSVQLHLTLRREMGSGVAHFVPGSLTSRYALWESLSSHPRVPVQPRHKHKTGNIVIFKLHVEFFPLIHLLILSLAPSLTFSTTEYSNIGQNSLSLSLARSLLSILSTREYCNFSIHRIVIHLLARSLALSFSVQAKWSKRVSWNSYCVRCSVLVYYQMIVT